MATFWLILLVTVNTVASQLLVKKVVGVIGGPSQHDSLVGFVMAAAAHPLVYLSLTLQVTGYVMWMVILSREKLGIAVAISGAFFYLLVSSMSWLIFGERLSGLQWAGIVLITLGVVCVGLQQT